MTKAGFSDGPSFPSFNGLPITFSIPCVIISSTSSILLRLGSSGVPGKLKPIDSILRMFSSKRLLTTSLSGAALLIQGSFGAVY